LAKADQVRAAFGPFCYLCGAMKKSAFSAALLLIGVLVPGCPVYDGTDIGCFDDLDCPYGYSCDPLSALCVSDSGNGSARCDEPADCGSNETCSRAGTCEAGDCHFPSVGCVSGFECSPQSGRWQCEREGDGDAGAPNAPSGNGGEPSQSGGEPSQSGGEPSSGGAPSESGGEAPSGSGGAGGAG
jgi:hypothetical protein